MLRNEYQGCRFYICHTIYHVYISALKSLKSGILSTVVLVDSIPAVDALAERLNAESIFSDICILRKGDYFINSHSYHANRLYVAFRRDVLKDKLNFLFHDDSDIYIFNDYTEIGALLNIAGKRYHLIEDGCDCYKNWDQTEPFGKAKRLKDFLWRHFQIPSGMGRGPNVIDLEVNDARGIRQVFDWPVVEAPRRLLMNGLAPEETGVLMRAFGAQCLCKVKPGSVVILTDPLWELGVVASPRENAELFVQMAARFHGYDVYLKPHPRDTWDYSASFAEGRILKADVPIELLNCLGEGIFDIAATWCSTAVNNLWACKHIVIFDPCDHRANARHETLVVGGDGLVS